LIVERLGHWCFGESSVVQGDLRIEMI